MSDYERGRADLVEEIEQKILRHAEDLAWHGAFLSSDAYRMTEELRKVVGGVNSAGDDTTFEGPQHPVAPSTPRPKPAADGGNADE